MVQMVKFEADFECSVCGHTTVSAVPHRAKAEHIRCPSCLDEFLSRNVPDMMQTSKPRATSEGGAGFID